MTDKRDWLQAAIKVAADTVNKAQRLSSDHPDRQRAERYLRELRLQLADQQDADADPGDLP